ncbi:MAG: hypothetical protein HOD64_08230, partial [Candidatus Cloacimonetes bacterium]|nr:hypothetical protein [Candidatus Cloacimonadota bacterium]
MKKALNILFVMFLLSGTLLFAANEVKVEVPTSDLDANATYGHSGSSADVLFDLQFEWPVGVGGGEAGIETDGNYIYTTKWNGAVFYRYEMDGTYVEEFTVAGAASVRDLAYDGQYFYGAAATTALFEMDFTPGAEVLVSTINAPIAVRGIAYDADADGFWANNWSDQITLFDRGGATLDSFACGVNISYYGFAWENVLPGGPYLWGYSQGGATLNELVQFDIATGLETGVQFDVGSVTGAGAGSAGGLCISDAFVPGKWTICGTSQNIIIWGLELADSAPLDAPGAPTAVTVVPDVGGALTADIDWICPDVQVNGDPLTDLDEMEVYRDDVLIYTDSSPTIGGPGSYADAVPASGTYTYKVLGVNSAGEGLPVVIATWVGEDVPNVVENLLLEQTNPGALSGTLTWDNPTTGLNGGAFNNVILGYHIERSDGVVFEVTGLVTEYVDGTIPAAGIYYYTVQAYNSIGDGGVAESNPVLIADAGLLVMEDFTASVPPTGWEVLGMSPGNWTQSATANAGGTAPEVMFSWTPSFTGFSALATMPLNTTGATTLHIEYMHFLNDFSGAGYTIGVKTTSDGGATWNDAITFSPTGDIGPELVVDDISTPDIGTATCQIGFFFDGYSFDLDYYYIDDVMVSMAAGDPGTIEGTVTLDGGTGDVEDVEVSAGGVTVNPDASGDYEITIAAGTYDVTAVLDGYLEAMEEDVVVVSGAATTGIDFTLEFIPATFDAPVNLAVDDNNLFTWEAPNTPSGLFEGFEGTFPPDGWLKLNPDGGTGWEPLQVGTTPLPGWTGGEATACPDGGDWQAYATWTTGGAASNDQWLITPQITVADGDMLDFWMAMYYDSYADYVEVLISTTVQNDVNAFDVVVAEIDLPAGTPSDWTQYTYNLTDFVAAGTPVYIAFREMVADNLGDGSAISIDNILVGTPASFNGVASNPQTSNITRELNYTHVPNTHVVATRELESYDVYLDGEYVENTTDLFWQFTNLVDGQEYEAGVVAVYTDGNSDMATILFNAISDVN